MGVEPLCRCVFDAPGGSGYPRAGARKRRRDGFCRGELFLVGLRRARIRSAQPGDSGPLGAAGQGPGRAVRVSRSDGGARELCRGAERRSWGGACAGGYAKDRRRCRRSSFTRATGENGKGAGAIQFGQTCHCSYSRQRRVFRAEQLQNRPATQSPARRAFADGYFPGRSGDLFIVPKAYWLMDGTAAGKTRSYGTGHGTPYNYDQHVPILLMGFGIQHGEYYTEATPADIAPTLAILCGITLASRDSRVLAEALSKADKRRPGTNMPTKTPDSAAPAKP